MAAADGDIVADEAMAVEGEVMAADMPMAMEVEEDTSAEAAGIMAEEITEAGDSDWD